MADDHYPFEFRKRNGRWQRRAKGERQWLTLHWRTVQTEDRERGFKARQDGPPTEWWWE